MFETTLAYLVVLKGANGSCRAVSEFDMKNRDVAATQFATGQSVTLFFLEHRHPTKTSSCLAHGEIHTTNINTHLESKGGKACPWLCRRALFWSRLHYVITVELT